jgi:hypothetical protein
MLEIPHWETESFIKSGHGFLSSAVFPSQSHNIVHAAVGKHFAHRIGWLPIGKRSAKDIRRAQRSGSGIEAGIGNDHQSVAFFRDLDHAHLHAAVNRADQYVDFVALHQPIGVLRRLSRFGFVIDGKVFQFAPGEFAAALRYRQFEAVGDGGAQLGVSAGVREHETDANLLGLRECRRVRQQCACREQAGLDKKLPPA